MQDKEVSVSEGKGPTDTSTEISLSQQLTLSHFQVSAKRRTEAKIKLQGKNNNQVSTEGLPSS